MSSNTFLTTVLASFALLGASCVSSQNGATVESIEGETSNAPAVTEGEYIALADGKITMTDWWPNQIDLTILHANSTKSHPLGADFDYAAEFAKVDLGQLKDDIRVAMTTSQEWWPADWGTYAGLFIRMAWHSAGTYRTSDGRGGSGDGTLRFAPLNSWPDNGNLDKSRRILWPVKQKYGQSVSWADLMVLAGNVALETAGFSTFGFAGGREDVWEPQDDIWWGPEGEMLADKRYHGDRELEQPLAAVQMGLIYVNPEGPNGNPDPQASAYDIRDTFGRMGMNDEETAALIVGGHTLGKGHGAAPAEGNVGAEPEGAAIEEQGFGWKNSYGKGNAEDTITSGLEGAWSSTPTVWSSGYLDNLYDYEWELTTAPSGAKVWQPKSNPQNVPDAHVDGKYNNPVMYTSDLALKVDPVYREITERWYNEPELMDEAFAKAWYKLTHRDMGPVARLVGPEVAPAQLWQDPVPEVDHPLIDANDAASLKRSILDSGVSRADLVSTAWSAASIYRDSDKRGGVNGARIALAPQNGWDANEPEQLAGVINALTQIQADFNAGQRGGKQVSLADLIVLGGNAAIEAAAADGGHSLELPFTPGRTDAAAETTDESSFAVLEPEADGFRNYFGSNSYLRPTEALVDRANLLTLTAPEMTALVGGMRVLGTNHDDTMHGVLTDRPGVLSNDFFANLLTMETAWSQVDAENDMFEGRDRASGEPRWTATSVDLVFGSHSQLRAISEVYASADGEQRFIDQFAAAWTKVMELDRFDLDR